MTMSFTADCCCEDGSQIGGELDSTGWLKQEWRVVVGQWATLKADQIILIAEPSLSMAA